MKKRLDNYKILEMIGKGGMATVYRALQESLDRTVALKELDLSQSQSIPAAAERFRLEARAAASLEHTCIINVYDFWEQDDKAYIAMELIDGIELKDGLVRVESLHPILALHIGRDVGEALQYAHGKGMIHRDVKPANIMLTTLGNVKLADFGIVSVTGSADLTMVDQILGTPAYMSPEQIKGDELTPQTDIFSLGIVLYEMVTGTRPFKGTNPVALIQSIVKDEPDPPGSLNPDVPAALSGVIMKCLEKDPGMRYREMGELISDMNRCLPHKAPGRAELVSGLVKVVMEASGTEATMPISSTQVSPPKTMSPDSLEMKRVADYDAGDIGFATDETTPQDLLPLRGLSGKEDVAEPAGPTASAVREVEKVELEFAERPDGTQVHEGADGTDVKRRRSRFPLFLGVIVVILAAVFLAPKDRTPPATPEEGRSVSTEKNIEVSIPELGEKKSGKPQTPAQVGFAYIKIIVRPTGSIFIDGKAIGDTKSGESFRVPSGLHSIVVKNPRLGSRSFLIDLAEGERKRIVVDFLKGRGQTQDRR